tara:strand:+ start:1058 stop:1468 length:411 start_codon:yes stop_codon:yes gene_type:complete
VRLTKSKLRQLILEEIRFTVGEAEQRSEKYLFDKIPEVCELHYNDLIVEKGNSDYGILAAYRHFMEGIKSKTNRPLSVVWIKEENKFLVVDGYHRLVESLLRGQNKYLCEIDWTGYTKDWSLPASNDRLILEDLFE